MYLHVRGSVRAHSHVYVRHLNQRLRARPLVEHDNLVYFPEPREDLLEGDDGDLRPGPQKERGTHGTADNEIRTEPPRN